MCQLDSPFVTNRPNAAAMPMASVPTAKPDLSRGFHEGAGSIGKATLIEFLANSALSVEVPRCFGPI